MEHTAFLGVKEKLFLPIATINTIKACTATVQKLKTTLLIFSKHHIILIEVSSLYKHSIVEFIIIECTVYKIREMKKIFIFPRIALAKGY